MSQPHSMVIRWLGEDSSKPLVTANLTNVRFTSVCHVLGPDKRPIEQVSAIVDAIAFAEGNQAQGDAA